jgi:hypothetical protein
MMVEGEILGVLYEVEDVVKKLPNVYETEATEARKKIESIPRRDCSPAVQQRFDAAKDAINRCLAEGRTWI